MSNTLFTTGAFIEPLKLPSGRWHWIVKGFEDDSFNEDGDCSNPAVSSETLEGLLYDASRFGEAETEPIFQSSAIQRLKMSQQLKKEEKAE